MLIVPRRIVIAQRCYSALANAKNVSKSGPLTELATRIKAGSLEADDHQKLVTNALQSIYDNIQSYQPAPFSESGGFFGLFSSSKTVKNGPMGLYVHGSVGGGKTTLMDLFYDCCSNVRIIFFFYFHILLTQNLLNSRFLANVVSISTPS